MYDAPDEASRRLMVSDMQRRLIFMGGVTFTDSRTGMTNEFDPCVMLMRDIFYLSYYKNKDGERYVTKKMKKKKKFND